MKIKEIEFTNQEIGVIKVAVLRYTNYYGDYEGQYLEILTKLEKLLEDKPK